jgi:phosphoenolpyruvate carboxylase
VFNESYEKLKKDINLLGDLLGQIVKEQAGEQVFNLIESIRRLSKLTLEDDHNAQQELLKLLEELTPDLFVPISKAFNQFLNFTNIAEEYQRIRQTRYEIINNFKPHPGSFEALIIQMQSAKIPMQEIYQALLKLNIEFVFTAHPTEVKRRTIMTKYLNIYQYLMKLDQMVLTEPERLALIEMLKSEMTAVWLTPEVREQKPTAIDEAKWGFANIEASLWSAVPQLMRELDSFCWQHFKQELPLDYMPLKFDTWMGGDRDGNPFVTSKITIRVCQMASWVAVDLLSKEIEKLIYSLSMSKCNDKVRELVGDAIYPYNFLIKQIHQKLLKASNYLTKIIQNDSYEFDVKHTDYVSKDEVLTTLLLCYESLIETNAKVIARAELLNVIRQVHCFGLTLMRLDIRQDASKHTECMDLIFAELQMPNSYSSLTENAKQEFLIKHIQYGTVILPDKLHANENFSEVLNTIRAIAKTPRECFGNYVISMASTVSDVLLIVFLQQQFNIPKLLPVVPLFEMGEALTNAHEVLDSLLNIEAYRKIIDNYQQIMIGYSDSAKDVGIVNASWLQYTAQERLTFVANKYNINLVFFHGRGGSVGRGGWPTHRAILSQPSQSINNFMRVTQQGEVIKNRFGLPEIAIKTMTIYITATLEAILLPSAKPQDSWRTLMDELAHASEASYQQLIYHNKDFIDYFLTCTPINELDKMALGSRPARRNSTDLTSIRNIRAIPWIFAWTQNRLLLPSWLGVGQLIQQTITNNQLAQIKLMAQQWPLFQSILAMTEIVLAKADPKISLYYERRLSTPKLHALGDMLREEFYRTKRLLLDLQQQDLLLVDNQMLADSINVRNPYILPLHLIQAELLYRTRGNNDENTLNTIQQALLICIAGVAAGMRNTG